jgi:hypothetical protein
MWFGLTDRHDLIPDFLGKRNIDQLIPVNMADLTPPNSIFSAAETVGMSGDPVPT